MYGKCMVVTHNLVKPPQLIEFANCIKINTLEPSIVGIDK